ncbi:DUF2061 domain-containing protein [Hydrogenophaga atypica]|uniref:DUF2061 domain-containing protein n=1 Tax=Hydrogenophaga atypica TaxID=249409 RepID=A0ABW2QRU6_9BURK|nr:DUF2061 domain-containing protein [Acidovorax sp.]
MNQPLKKTLTFSAIHFSVSFGVTFALTGDWRVSGAVAFIEPCVNTVAYFFHEKFWSQRSPSSGLQASVQSV